MSVKFFKKVIVIALFLGLTSNLIALDEKQQNNTPLLTLSKNENGSFNGVFNNAPLRGILKKVSSYTGLEFSVLPQVDASYTLKFTNWSGEKLIDRVVRDISNYRFFVKNNTIRTTKSLILLDSDGKDVPMQQTFDIGKADFDFDKRFNGINQATKLNVPLIELPEVVALMALSEQQKQHDLFYKRVVNPKNPASAYTFKVRYSKQHKMMIPFKKNGKPESKKAEGFMNFYTVANAIIKKQNFLEVYRNGKDVYLRFKDKALKDTFMLISGDETNMEVVQKVGTKGLPNMQSRLIGNQDEFTTLTEIHHPKGTVILADVVITQ